MPIPRNNSGMKVSPLAGGIYATQNLPQPHFYVSPPPVPTSFRDFSHFFHRLPENQPTNQGINAYAYQGTYMAD